MPIADAERALAADHAALSTTTALPDHALSGHVRPVAASAAIASVVDGYRRDRNHGEVLILQPSREPLPAPGSNRATAGDSWS
jgi:hypothetical protein